MPASVRARRGRLATLVAVLGLLLVVGCRAGVELDVAVDRHGGGQLTLALTADERLLTAGADAGVDPLGQLAAVADGLAADRWRTVDRTDAAGVRRVAVTTTFADAERFNALTADLAAAIAGPELAPLESLRLTVDDERVTLVGAAGLVPTAAVGELGLTPEEAVRLLRDTGALGYEIRVSLPGEVLETSAVERDGSLLIWRIEPGERLELVAVGRRPRPPVWPLAAGALGGALLAAALLRGLGRRGRRADAGTPPPGSV